MEKICLIGQAPNRTGDPRKPLLGSIGEKIAAMCGITLDQYLITFDRINVLNRYPGKAGKGDAFPMAAARRRAARINLPARMIFVGKQAAAAFEFRAPFLTWRSMCIERRAAIIPHPSGVNRWYNDPENLKKINEFMHLVAAHEISK